MKKQPSVKKVYRKHVDAFAEMFGAPLSQFWDSLHGGFLMREFCTQIVEYDGDRPGEATEEKFGPAARRLINDIMWDLRRVWWSPS